MTPKNISRQKTPAPAPSSKRSFLGYDVGLLALGVATGLIAGEVLLRIFWPTLANGLRVYDFAESERGKFCQYDQELGWAGKPNAEDDFQWADCFIHVKINRYGFRGPAYDLARSDKPRFVVLGDSFVWGFGVDEDDILTRRIERESVSPVEVVNLGVSGYGTDQELLTWERSGKLWKPDHVVLCVTLSNDLIENMMTNAYSHPKPIFRIAPNGTLSLQNVPVPFNTDDGEPPEFDTKETWQVRIPGFLRRSAVVNVALLAASKFPAAKSLLVKAKLLPGRRDESDWELPQYLVQQSPLRQNAWELLSRLIANMKTSAAHEGAKLEVAGIPSIIQVYTEMWDKTAARHPEMAGQLDPELPQKSLAEICRRLNVPFIDLLPPLREAVKSNDHLYYPLNLHWTSDGHRVAAETLLKYFKLNRT